MKRISVLFVALVMLLAACGTKEDVKKAEGTKKATEETVKKETKVDGYTLKEPQEDTKCAACDMKVYQKDHKHGKYSAQAIGEDGKNYFFDDLFCLLNYERKSGKKMKARFVRDHNSLEWINVDKANFVKGDIKTPMNVGIASFKTEKEAKVFAEKFEAEIEKLSSVDKKAMMRFMEKQKEMKKGNKEQEHEM
ncbi:nitrous oxide reductase accessory protein NosL [Macrococcus animalis]|uniref:nitrous oxide reductase accessory protein NosL n=1 Tax=Macrococcus animalis TaxID=3395467 RepID=UPI0039BE6219